MKVEDILTLMKGMSEHRISLVELPGVKLVAGIPDRPTTAAANNISVPEGMKRFQAAAQAEASKQADRLAGMQARTAAARVKAAGGTSVGLGAAVQTIYKDAMATPPPPSAPSNDTSS